MKTKPAKALKATRPASPLRLSIRSILVPIDFSSPSRKTLDHALALAAKFGAKLTLMHVVEPVATADFAGAFPLAVENDVRMAASKRELAGLVKTAGIPRGRLGGIVVRCGRSFYEIVDVARLRKMDLIVIATHGYTGWKHALLGSTTERVVRHASCPVLVVRDQGAPVAH